MGLREFLETVQVKCEEAKGLCLAGKDSLAISTLQQVATIISSEFGATDEVAAASPEGDEKSEEAETVALPGKYVQVHEHIRNAEIAFAAGIVEQGREHIGLAADLLKEILATELE